MTQVCVAFFAGILFCRWFPQESYTYSHGAIIRGDRAEKRLALVFTGDSFGEGGEHILHVLQQRGVKASFFFTGNFYRNPAFPTLIKNLKAAGHYLGAHSDAHLLYCTWENRDSLLVTRAQFEADLAANYREMARCGIAKAHARFFVPPYEWYNEKISTWAKDWGVQLVNYTPGTRAAADYTFPGMGDRYVSSAGIMQSIWSYAKEDPAGLNGFILLLHIGTVPERLDKFYIHLDELLQVLQAEGYRCQRVDELLGE